MVPSEQEDTSPGQPRRHTNPSGVFPGVRASASAFVRTLRTVPETRGDGGTNTVPQLGWATKASGRLVPWGTLAGPPWALRGLGPCMRRRARGPGAADLRSSGPFDVRLGKARVPQGLGSPPGRGWYLCDWVSSCCFCAILGGWLYMLWFWVLAMGHRSPRPPQCPHGRQRGRLPGQLQSYSRFLLGQGSSPFLTPDPAIQRPMLW